MLLLAWHERSGLAAKEPSLHAPLVLVVAVQIAGTVSTSAAFPLGCGLATCITRGLAVHAGAEDGIASAKSRQSDLAATLIATQHSALGDSEAWVAFQVHNGTTPRAAETLEISIRRIRLFALGVVCL